MNLPLVSVIALCYNHEKYLEEAVDSVLGQDYPNVELIIVDDASSDHSPQLIRQIAGDRREVKIELLGQNVGNCKAFNQGLSKASGKYIIDFATDDLLQPDRISVGVKVLEESPEHFGVHFCDAWLIDESGHHAGRHYQQVKGIQCVQEVPQGDVYEAILKHYFISAPTMLIKKLVFDYLGGYDETLAYEDFDFWVRSARKFHYAFSPLPLVKKRIISGSLSSSQYIPGSKILFSTVKVCAKALALNINEAENKALAQRIEYELKHAILSGNHDAALQFFQLLDEIAGYRPTSRYYLYRWLLKLPLKRSWWYSVYRLLSLFSSILR